MKRSQSPQLPAPDSGSGSDSSSPPDLEFERSTAYIPDVVAEAPAATPGGEQAAADAPPVSLVSNELIEDALDPTFRAIYSAMAKRRGPHWLLEDYQAKALVKGWTPILQLILARLGSETEILLTVAIGSTVAVTAGKMAHDTKLALSKASIRTPGSEASSASSGSATPGKQPAPSGSFEEPDES